MRLTYVIFLLLLGIAIGSLWVNPSKNPMPPNETQPSVPDPKSVTDTKWIDKKQKKVTDTLDLSIPRPRRFVNDTVSSQEMAVQDFSSSNITHEIVHVPLTSWQQLMTLIGEKKWSEVIIFHDENTFGPQAHPASLWRAKALLENIQSQGNLLSFQQTKSLLQNQLLLTPAHSGVHLKLAESEFQQGQVQQALSTLEQGANLSQDSEEASALLSHRDAMVQQHIDFLLRNEHWQEIITFVRSEPASSSPHYYAHQLAAAHAHAQLFQWEEAKSLLNMAEFDPNLYTAIAELRTAIKKGEEHMLLKQQEFERKNLIDQQILGNADVDHQGYMKLPFEKNGNAILVPFFIGDQKLKLLFDTGASITMISKSWIEKTKYQHLAQLEPKVFITAGGRVQSPMIRIQQVRFGPLTFKHVDIAFQNIFEPHSGIDGLLGMNVLKYYEIKFDFDASTLRLKAKY